MTEPEGRSQSSHESQLWDALEEAEDDGAWPDEASTEFRSGYRAALRFALAVVTNASVPRERPTADASNPTPRRASSSTAVADFEPQP